MDVIARNEFMVSHSYLIKRSIYRNMTLLKALGLETNDVYQELAIAMLKAIDGFDPRRSDSLAAHVTVKLQYAILKLKEVHKPCGLTGQKGKRVSFASIEGYYSDGRPLEIYFEDDFGEVEISEVFAILTADERETLCQRMEGIYHRKKYEQNTLISAQRKAKEFLYA